MDEDCVIDEVKLNRIVFTDEVNKAIDQVIIFFHLPKKWTKNCKIFQF